MARLAMPIDYTTTQWPVKRIIEWRLKSKMRIPRHQRGYVWDSKHRTALIDTIIRGLPISSITLSGTDLSGNVYFIEDGQQRVETLVRFCQNKFDYEGLYFNGLDEDKQYKILNYKIPVLIYTGATEEERIEIFDRLQNGIILSYGERFHAMRFLSPMVEYTCDVLLHEDSKLQRECEEVWGTRLLDEDDSKKGDGTKRFRNLREAVAIVSGTLWGPEFFSDNYDALREKLRKPLTEEQKKKSEILMKSILKIYRRAIRANISGEDKMNEKQLKDSFWNPKNFTGYILYTLWENYEDTYKIKQIEEKWVDFLIQYRKKPNVLKDRLLDITKGIGKPEAKFKAGWLSINNVFTQEHD